MGFTHSLAFDPIPIAHLFVPGISEGSADVLVWDSLNIVAAS